MTKIALVGTGVLGSSWAIVFSRAGLDVSVYDADPAAVERMMDHARRALAASTGPEQGAADDGELILSRIRPAPSLEAALGDAEYIQESAPERLELKIELYKQLDALATPNAVLASSTSGLPASSFTAELPHRRRCLVVHPLNPPHLIPLVEIVPAPWTASEVVDQATDLMRKVGQSPIRLRHEINGFVVNRLQGALLAEAFRLVQDGVLDAEEVDLAVTEGLGLRWFFLGPFQTIDLNADGGIATYCRNFGSMYHELAREQADPRPWSPALVETVETNLRKRTPIEALPSRRARRDKILTELVSIKARHLQP